MLAACLIDYKKAVLHSSLGCFLISCKNFLVPKMHFEVSEKNLKQIDVAIKVILIDDRRLSVRSNLRSNFGKIEIKVKDRAAT